MRFGSTKHLGLNTLPNGICISTIPSETCIFYPDGNSDVVKYYTDEAEAIAGHHEILMGYLAVCKYLPTENAEEEVRKLCGVLSNILLEAV